MKQHDNRKGEEDKERMTRRNITLCTGRTSKARWQGIEKIIGGYKSYRTTDNTQIGNNNTYLI
jgi:hypothetical protein